MVKAHWIRDEIIDEDVIAIVNAHHYEMKRKRQQEREQAQKRYKAEQYAKRKRQEKRLTAVSVTFVLTWYTIALWLL